MFISALFRSADIPGYRLEFLGDLFLIHIVKMHFIPGQLNDLFIFYEADLPGVFQDSRHVGGD